MKEFKYCIAAILSFWGIQFSVLAQSQIEYLQFSENISCGTYFQQPVAGSHMQKAAGTVPGRIEIDTVPNWLNSVSSDKKSIIETSIKRAINIWNLYLNGYSLRLGICLDPNIPHDIETTVMYQAHTDATLYALSFYRSFTEYTSVYNDAYITINPQENWGVGYENSEKNLTLGLLRAIGHSLGFGSTLHLSDIGFVISPTTYYSPFDKLIFSSSGQYLKDIPKTGTTTRPNTKLQNFANPQIDSIFVYKRNEHYQLYAPSVFEDHGSFRYFANNNSIMSYQTNDELPASIDSTTLNLLTAIGWEFRKQQPISIVSTDIDSTGYASAYSSHHFQLNGITGTVSDYYWEFLLPLRNGGKQVIATSSSPDFIIPAVTNETLYEITDNREILGEIHFTGIQNGQGIKASYLTRLQLKPKIISIDILEKKWNEQHNGYYDISLSIRYEGSFYIYTTIEEEYGIWFNSQTSYTPYYSRLTFENVDSYGDAWITVTARNEYGTDSQMIKVSAPNSTWPSKSSVNDIDNELHNDEVYKKEYNNIKLYNAKGIYIATIQTKEELPSICKSGEMYILTMYTRTVGNKTFKFRFH